MKTAFRFGKIFLSLVVLIGLLIVLPAYLEKQLFSWQICFLAISYLLFFIPTIWRATKENSANQEENKQVKNLSVRVASLIGVVGLVAVHWSAIYEHFQIVATENTLNNILFSIMGIILILSGVMLNQIAVNTLGRFFDRLTQTQLVTSGIYGQVRHPIYTSYLLLFIGFCTFLQSWLSLVALTLVCARWFSNKISIEEEMLLEEFGEDYQTYSQQTKKLIPLVY